MMWKFNARMGLLGVLIFLVWMGSACGNGGGTTPWATTAIPGTVSRLEAGDTAMAALGLETMQANQTQNAAWAETAEARRTLTAQAKSLTAQAPTRTATVSLPPTATAELEAVWRGPFRAAAYAGSVLSGWITGLHAMPDGGVWLAGEGGLARWRGESWEAVLTDFEGVWAGVDEAGRVWVIEEGGGQVSAWDGDSWTAYADAEGWSSIGDEYWSYVQPSAMVDETGRLWLATTQDVRVLEGERWRVYTPEEMGMPEIGEEDMVHHFNLAAAEGMVWVGQCDWGGPGPFGGRGVRWFDGDSWQGAASPVSEGCANLIEGGGDGQVWVGLEAEVWRYTAAAGRWTGFRPPEPPVEGQRFGYVKDLETGPGGEVWAVLVLCGGASCGDALALYRIQDGVWTQAAEVGWPLPVSRVATDGEGRVWLFWNGVVYGMEGGEFWEAAALTPRFLAVEGDGRVWVVADFEGQEVLWVLEG